MEYQIYKKEKVLNTINTNDGFDSWKKGKINLNNLQSSNFDPILSKIPQSNAEELKRTGKTCFTIVTKNYVTITK